MEQTIDAAAAWMRLAEQLPKLRGSEVRLLARLTAQAVAGGQLEVTANDRQIKSWLRIGFAQITRAKRRLAELGLVYHESSPGHRTGVWYLKYLRDAGVHPFRVQGAPVSGAGVHPFREQGAPVSGAGAPVSGAGSSHGPRLAAGPPAGARRFESAVVTTGSFSSIDRVLTAQKLEPDQFEAAYILQRHLVSWAARDGVPGLTDRPIDEQIQAQCLAIGPLGVLENAWLNTSARLNGHKVTGWAFFVTALLVEVCGVTPTEVKARRVALRKSTTAGNGVRDTSYPQEIVGQLLRGVKSLT